MFPFPLFELSISLVFLFLFKYPIGRRLKMCLCYLRISKEHNELEMNKCMLVLANYNDAHAYSLSPVGIDSSSMKFHLMVCDKLFY